MALSSVRIIVLLICVIDFEGVLAGTSFIATYCDQHGKILNCHYNSHEELPFMSIGTSCEFNKIFINNFPRLEVEDTSCADLIIENSNITFKDIPVKQCPRKRVEIRSSHIVRLPGEVSELVSYGSTINVLRDIQLKFADIHDSEINSVSKLRLHSSDVSFFDSKILFNDTFIIDDCSSVKFIKSNVNFHQGSHISVQGELTLQGTTIDIRFIYLNSSSKLHILSPKEQWLSNEEKDSENYLDENEGMQEILDPSDSQTESNHNIGEKPTSENAVLLMALFLIFLRAYHVNVNIADCLDFRMKKNVETEFGYEQKQLT